MVIDYIFGYYVFSWSPTYIPSIPSPPRKGCRFSSDTFEKLVVQLEDEGNISFARATWNLLKLNRWRGKTTIVLYSNGDLWDELVMDLRNTINHSFNSSISTLLTEESRKKPRESNFCKVTTRGRSNKHASRKIHLDPNQSGTKDMKL